MNRHHLLSALIAVVLYMASGNVMFAAGDKAPVLVTPTWLAGHLNDPNLVVLNVAQNAREYRGGHIPGARFLWVPRIAASNPELSF